MTLSLEWILALLSCSAHLLGILLSWFVLVVESLNLLQKLLASIFGEEPSFRVMLEGINRRLREGSLASGFESGDECCHSFLSICVCPSFWRRLARFKRSIMFLAT